VDLFRGCPIFPTDTYDIVAPLRAAGYTHHIAVPIALPNGIATLHLRDAHTDGFSGEDVAVLRSIMPTLGALQETSLRTA